MPQVTLQDVAEAAGVSVKTVSRVANNEPYVKAEVRERVLALLSHMNYQPNLSARRLKGVATYNITLVYEPPGSEFLTSILEGALPVFRETNYQLILEPLQAAESRQRIEQMIARRTTDGFILLPPLSEDHALVERILDAQLKVVLVASTLAALEDGTRVSKVGIDDYKAGMQVGRHLIEQGHKRIAYIALREPHNMGNQRGEGLRAAIAEAGLPASNYIRVSGDSSFVSGKVAAKKALMRKVPPTAIFAGNDVMAGGAAAYAEEAGLTIPGDVAICGFDGSDYSKMIRIPLTTVEQPLRQYGERSADILLAHLSADDQAPVQVDLPFAFLPRASSLKA